MNANAFDPLVEQALESIRPTRAQCLADLGGNESARATAGSAANRKDPPQHRRKRNAELGNVISKEELDSVLALSDRVIALTKGVQACRQHKPTKKVLVAQTVGSALQALGFDAEELAALRQKGTIHQERRGRNTIIFKLRYRMAGRQRVKYLGTDRRLVEQIQAELTDLQAAHRRNRQLRQLGAQARTLLREYEVPTAGSPGASGPEIPWSCHTSTADP